MEVLYNNIKDKSKVKVNKAAVEVNLLDSGVEVKTKDGDCFTGDIVVGADGIHSTIRKEMWRIANTIEPGYIPQSEYTGPYSLISLTKTWLMLLISHALRLQGYLRYLCYQRLRALYC